MNYTQRWQLRQAVDQAVTELGKADMQLRNDSVSDCRYYVATFNTFRGPWYVVEKIDGEIVSEHETMMQADNAAFRLERGSDWRS